MKLKFMLFGMMIFAMLSISLINPVKVLSEEVKKDEVNIFTQIIKKTMGKGVKVMRIETPEKSPVKGWVQTRVWIESVYGETPVLIYSSEDSGLIFAGSVFDAKAENLTRRDVGETIPKVIEESAMEIGNEYMIGNPGAEVRVVLWIGGSAFSGNLFNTFYDLYNENKEKVVLYIKFYPLNAKDIEKMKAITCYKGEALAKGLNIVYKAAAGWGSSEELDAFRYSGNPGTCNDDKVLKDLKLAADLGLPRRPVVFVNRTMLIERATRENIEKLAGIKLNQ